LGLPYSAVGEGHVGFHGLQGMTQRHPAHRLLPVAGLNALVHNFAVFPVGADEQHQKVVQLSSGGTGAHPDGKITEWFNKNVPCAMVAASHWQPEQPQKIENGEVRTTK